MSTANVTGFARAASGVVCPESVAEVQALVREAARTRTRLHPFSTGLNWGYGSRSPVGEGALLVDLSKMRRIRNADAISLDHPVAVLEPGVTQRQLHAHLSERCPTLGFNVTGAGADTSILGNALDRGVGYFGPRKDDLFGLEVVTGTGELLYTGFRRLGEASPLAHAHPYGLGPILDGLFFQGNFGIVTSACFRLVPRRPVEIAVSMTLRPGARLADLLTILGQLKRDGLLTSVTHVGNRARTRSSLAYGMTRYLEAECGLTPEAAAREVDRAIAVVARGAWTGLAAITGNAGQVRAALAELRARLGEVAKVMVMTDRRLDLGYALANALRVVPLARAHAAAIASIRALHQLALGVPTDVPVENLLWKYGDGHLAPRDLDTSKVGLLYVSPALPSDGEAVAAFVEKMDALAAAHGQALYTTLNLETPTSLVGVVNLLFDRSSAEETARAHHLAEALLALVHAEGLEVYRARVDMMADVVARDPGYWRTVRSLKSTFDPHDLIAPGRYNLAG